MMIIIEMAGPLSRITGGVSKIPVEGAATVEEALHQLIDRYPEAEKKLLRGSELSKRVLIYVDGTDIRGLNGGATPVGSASRIKILPTLTGG